jgi:NAD(P)-dependent dehydrogenase (short-subunit alcohol dehydrogenase family)
MSGVAVVTGGGGGIGRGVAASLSEAGWTVVVAGRTRSSLDETVSTFAEQGLAVVADVSNEESVDALFATTVEQFGRVDLLFNNAGVAARAKPIDELDVAEWRHVIDVNLTGSFLCARAAFRQMKVQDPRGGRIINNGSVSATTPRPFSAPYTASKHAITGLTKSLSLDGRTHDIACGQIDIGNAATDMTRRMATGIMQANGEVKPEASMDVSNVGDAVLYMAGLPLSANVLTMTVMATEMPFVGRG